MRYDIVALWDLDSTHEYIWRYVVCNEGWADPIELTYLKVVEVLCCNSIVNYG